jgi:hypothetical protein
MDCLGLFDQKGFCFAFIYENTLKLAKFYRKFNGSLSSFFNMQHHNCFATARSSDEEKTTFLSYELKNCRTHRIDDQILPFEYTEHVIVDKHHRCHSVHISSTYGEYDLHSQLEQDLESKFGISLDKRRFPNSYQMKQNEISNLCNWISREHFCMKTAQPCLAIFAGPICMGIFEGLEAILFQMRGTSPAEILEIDGTQFVQSRERLKPSLMEIHHTVDIADQFPELKSKTIINLSGHTHPLGVYEAGANFSEIGIREFIASFPVAAIDTLEKKLHFPKITFRPATVQIRKESLNQSVVVDTGKSQWFFPLRISTNSPLQKFIELNREIINDNIETPSPLSIVRNIQPEGNVVEIFETTSQVHVGLKSKSNPDEAFVARLSIDERKKTDIIFTLEDFGFPRDLANLLTTFVWSHDVQNVLDDEELLDEFSTEADIWDRSTLEKHLRALLTSHVSE